MRTIFSSKIIVKTFTLFILLFSLTNIIFSKSANQDQLNPFYVDPGSQDFSRNPELLERIISDPHGYLRFINIPFSQDVCKRFRKYLISSPSLNLHGDAHLEQYAVTDLGRGLTDYDDSSTGPGIIDWMRMGVSLHLATVLNGWEEHSETLFNTFLKGYRDALNDPKTIAPEPKVVQRIKSKFTIDREKYFQWINSIMVEIPAGEKDSLLIAAKPYFDMMLTEQPDKSPDYYKVISVGYLQMGIGSALDLKYLIRIEGETANPLDDIVLEVKQVRDLSGIECINSGRKTDPFRILLGQARIAYQPFHNLGYFEFRNIIFWVHSWVDNYKEVNIKKSFESVDELAEVMYDIGVQLGKGHVKHIAAPLDLQLRHEQLLFLKRHEKEIKKVRIEFADQVIRAWELFCENLDKQENN